jgi:hypothetical protein
MTKRSAYREDVQWWIDCLTERVSGPVRIRGAAKIELLHAELREHLQEIRAINRRLETCGHEKLPRLIEERVWTRTIVRQLICGILRWSARSP